MKNIAVLMGGYSSESQISLKSGAVIAESIDPELYTAYPIHILEEGWYYKDKSGQIFPVDKNDFSLHINGSDIRFDCLYNTIHGHPGEDGILQGYLELLNLPQSSCNSYTSAVTFNKRDCIAILQPWQIPTAQHIYLNKGEHYNTSAIVDQLGLPIFIKANRSGSSFGVYKIYEEKEIDDAIHKAYEIDHQLIIESFLDGIEVSVGVYQLDDTIHTLPPTEIVSDNDFFDYEAKYQGKSQEITPARISKLDTKAVQELTQKIYQILGCKGIARADFIFHNNQPHFIEINTNPGMSKESIIPQQIKASGSNLRTILTQVIENTIKHHLS